jgi:pyruvate kinase
MTIGMKVFIGHGEIVLEVDGVFGESCTCFVVKSGTLRQYQEVFISKIFAGAINEMKLPTETDILDIKFAHQNKIDFLIVSVEENILPDFDFIKKECKGVKVLVKIINILDIDMTKEVIEKSDGIIFAFHPGSHFSKTSALFYQKMVIDICRSKMKTCYCTADSEISVNELSKMTNEIIDVTDGILLTQNQSHSEQIEKIESMETIAKLANNKSMFKIHINEAFSIEMDLKFALTSAAVKSSLTTHSSAIVILSNNHNLTRYSFFLQPKCTILSVATRKIIANQLNIYKGVIPLWYNKEPSYEDMERFAINYLILRGITALGQTVIILTDENMRISYISYDFK